ncbi:hypothetical protein I317_07084 [Kwoniella heveanensis CBS 569]|nr:hypothetical protein I317_07084 [Kwoniella heveanensis CBS 569]
MPKPLPKLDTTYTEESPDPRDPLAVALDRHLEDAIILAQLIPESRLAPYAELLKPLLPPPPPAHPAPGSSDPPPPPPPLPPHYNPLISSIAATLHALASVKAAEAEAAKKAEEAKKKEEDEIKKWETWCNAYGRTNRADWRAMPGNPAWTWWGWNEIGKEEWWKGRNE